MFGGHEAIKVETKSFLGSWLVPGAGADHSWHKEGFKAWRGDLLQLTRRFFVFGLGKWDEDFNTSFGSMHHFCWSSKSGQKLYVLSKLWIFFSHFLVGKKQEKLLLKI